MRRLLLLVLCLAGCFSKPPAPQLGDGDGGLDANGGDGGNSGDSGDSGTPPPNYMFVTSGTKVGSMLGTISEADQLCSDSATVGGLAGSYRAWVSTASTNAKDRLVIPGTSTQARGWIRPDGRPFADSVADITAGKTFYPPRISEAGIDIFLDGEVAYTGTTSMGVATGSDCASGGSTVTVGMFDGGGAAWTDAARVLSCSNLFHVYCFGVDRAVQVTVPQPPAGALRAFLSTPVAITAFSLTAWQQHCDAEGRNNGFPGTYVPFVARTNTSARGLLPLLPAGWYRPDNVEVAADKNFATFLAPINVQANNLYVTHEQPSKPSVYAGASTFDLQATTSSSCDNWSNENAGTVHNTGDGERSGPGSFTGNTNSNCFAPHRVYCFQTAQ